MYPSRVHDLVDLRLATLLLAVSQMISNAEGQISYGLVGGATSISATSIHTHDDWASACQPKDAKYSNRDECWCSDTQDCSDNPILTINLGSIHKITSLGVKSCSWEEYITSYKIEYYYGDSWTWYNNGQSLTGNDGCCTERTTSLSPAVIATQIRLYPLAAQDWCSTNFEVYGHPWTATQSPTPPTPSPTLPTRRPTRNPVPTHTPSNSPTNAPTSLPSMGPTFAPTRNYTSAPMIYKIDPLMSSHITISGLSIIALSWLFGIISAYCLYQFYQLQSSRRQSVQEMTFIKRRANIVVAYSLCSIFVLLIGYPAGMLVHWGFEFMVPITTDNRSATFIVLELFHLIDIFVYYLAAVFILLRYWMIYYDIQLSNSCLNLEWKHCISKSKAALHREKWYIQHRTTLGNVSYMTRIAILIISCVSLFSMAMHASFTLFDLHDIDFAPFISSVVVLTGFIALIIIWHKMPLFTDKIYLYKEFRILAFFWIVITIVYGFSTIYSRFTDNLFFSFFGHFCAVFMQFIVSFVSTFWVLKFIIGAEMLADMAPSCSAGLEEIFRDENRLNLFMQHLIKEFSMECLLSVIEFQQYKCVAMKALNLNLEAQDNDTVFLQGHVPQSDIVFKYGEMYHDSNMVSDDVKFVFKIKAYKLYKKYIEPGSRFEVNVCSKTRQKLRGSMEDYDKWVDAESIITDCELINIFDRATSEMLQFLHYSKSNM